MYKEKKILAIIPARGGSKGIPHKNIKKIAGKPLIFWTIEEAKRCASLDKIIVSTDDNKIADISRGYGIEVPFLRPKALSRDSSSSVDLVLHAIRYFESKGDKFDIFVLLQPTSPLRMHYDIGGALETLFRKKASGVVSLSEVKSHVLLSNKLPKNGCMKDFPPAHTGYKPRQNLPKVYGPNGAIYLGFVGYIKKHKKFYGSKTFAYLMDRGRSVDIDDILDFKLAEALLNERKKPNR
ncbi:MAG: acylneuraminate cytidylyltransferase family protein [Candidatus Omnitrophica bacterium]|nr:acylneuraminate cytidylyltransferase family protein [Candidatus Omnitrophota bacterium]